MGGQREEEDEKNSDAVDASVESELGADLPTGTSIFCRRLRATRDRAEAATAESMFARASGRLAEILALCNQFPIVIKALPASTRSWPPSSSRRVSHCWTLAVYSRAECIRLRRSGSSCSHSRSPSPPAQQEQEPPHLRRRSSCTLSRDRSLPLQLNPANRRTASSSTSL